MLHVAFAIDQSGGNATYQANLRHALTRVPDLRATFLPVSVKDHDHWSRVPGLSVNKALLASARAASGLRAAHRSQPLDAAFIHSQSLALLANPLMRRVPTLISSDGTPANYDTFASELDHRVYGRRIEKTKTFWTRKTLRRARHLLAFSTWVKDSYINDYGVPEERITVIPSGVHPDLWSPAPDPVRTGGPVRILFVGGMFTRKGGDVLLDYKRNRPGKDIELHLVTQSPVPADPAHGVFLYSAMQANSPALIDLARSCDVFALPTRGDCFPFAVIEASSVGLPVVVSDVGGMREIAVDGETGFLVPRGEDAAYFDRLDRLVADETLRKSMGAAGRTRVLEHLDAGRNALRVLGLLRTVATSLD